MQKLLLILLLTIPSWAAGDTKYRIIDGTASPAGSFSAVARLELADGSCTGTLVHPHFVLTAAHCFFDDRNRRTTHDTQVSARFFDRTVTSTRVFIHPTYVARSEACIEGEVDAAMVELSSTIDIIPVSLVATPVSVGTMMLLAGYGERGSGRRGGNSTEPPAGIIDSGPATVEGVSATYFSWIFSQGESNTGAGDSGGPAFVTTSEGQMLGGIICGGDGHSEWGTESVNTRADVIKPWSDSVISGVQDGVPQIIGSSRVNGIVGQTFSFPIFVTGAGPFSYAVDALPAGLILKDNVITGTPTKNGQFTATVAVTSALGSATQKLQIVISNSTSELEVRRVSLEFNRKRTGGDYLALTGRLEIGPNFTPRGKRVQVQIGRFIRRFKLDEHAHAKAGNDTFQLDGRQRGSRFATPKLNFELLLQDTHFLRELTTLGFTDRTQVVWLPLSITANGIELTRTTPLRFRSSDKHWVIKR